MARKRCTLLEKNDGPRPQTQRHQASLGRSPPLHIAGRSPTVSTWHRLGRGSRAGRGAVHAGVVGGAWRSLVHNRGGPAALQ